MPKILKKYYKILPLLILLIIATAVFIYNISKKNPYLSDSLFYKHYFYEMQGNTFDEARQRVLANHQINWEDNIQKRLIQDEKLYKNSYTFFKKRPLYPLVALTFYSIIKNEYLSFAIPILLAYLASIILAYYFFNLRLGLNYSILATGLLIAFPPFYIWSTYFMTDVIGLLFWLVNLLLAYKYLISKNKKWLVFFAFTLLLSLINREQGILMLPLFAILAVLIRKFKLPKNIIHSNNKLVLICTSFLLLYLAIIYLTKQKTAWDTLVYYQNYWGTLNKVYTPEETLLFLGNSIINEHKDFIQAVINHYWISLLLIIAIFEAIRTFISKGRNLIDIIMISSGLASYLAIFIYPSFAFRYFFPTTITILYFSAKFFQNYFEKEKI